MRAADRLVDDLVDQAQRLQAVRGDAELLGGVGGALGGLPQDRRAAFGRDHRIGRVLQHQQLVADADRQRAARAALADDGGDDRHLELRHLEDVAADRLRLAALLGADAGIGARRVDEGEHRQAELLGQLHQAQRLAIALGPRHAEVAQPRAPWCRGPSGGRCTMQAWPLKRARPPTIDWSSAKARSPCSSWKSVKTSPT